MLSYEDNELLTRVGSGTGMGELLRRFWLPALLEEEVAEPDGPPVRLRLLGEDLVAFRDSAGRIGILDAYCPHRRAHLYFGRNEECGLRCVYHGWKFDVDGNCVEMPSEPPETDFKHKVRQTAYPAIVRGGVVFVYMGPKALEPELPAFEWFRLPAAQRTATKRLQQCNWAQAVEGGIDSSHISFLHSTVKAPGAEGAAPRNPLTLSDRSPRFTVTETDYGLLIGARRSAGEKGYYWRLTQYLVPFWQMIPPVVPEEDTRAAAITGHCWVPIDDENTWTWTFSVQPHRAFTDAEQQRAGGRDGQWGPVDENYRPIRNKDNDYLIDRAAQKSGHFTGIDGIPNQDGAVQESMGPITDRTKERLGQSDTAVIQYRRLILQLAKELRQGKAPEAAYDGARYNVRSAALLLPEDADWVEGSAWLRAGHPLTQEAAE